MQTTQILRHYTPAQLKNMKLTGDQVDAIAQAAARNPEALNKLGIGLDPADMTAMSKAMGIGMDADLVAPLTTSSVPTPIQFLQYWLPGNVDIITAKRAIDVLTGRTVAGSFADEEIVQPVVEYTGDAREYGDFTNVPQSNWNIQYERRSVVRFEEGMMVGRLEEMRSSATRQSSADNKRYSVKESLEIVRNDIGFNGYNSGSNRTYGFLNEPNLPAYVSVPNGAGGSSEWSDKVFLEIVSDLLTALAQLRNQSRDRIDVKRDPIMLALPTSKVDFLSTVSQFGNSVYEWLKENYPNVTVESVPELDNANGGDDVFYLYAISVGDSGSDDSMTWLHLNPTQMQSMGVEQKAKSYEESYANATAGQMLKRPYAVVRYSGI